MQLQTRRTLFALCTALLLLSVLSGVGLIGNQRALERGIPRDLPQPIADADISPFCINVGLSGADDEEIEWTLDLIDEGGIVWVRQTFPWAQIEPSPGEYDWDRWDTIVNSVTDRGLHLIAVLDTAPAWAGTPPPPGEFARFAWSLSERYGDRVDYYQIWHNPNLADGWGEPANPAAYAELLQRSATAIRDADNWSTQSSGPESRLILGSLAPTVEQGPDNLSEVRFLERLYAAGAAPYFDILAAQPFGFDTGPDDRRVDEETLNLSRVVLIRELAVSNGDGAKPIWASHFGWNSPRTDWDETPSIWGQVDETTQASHTAAALERAQREWPWMGALCLAHFQPDSVAPPLASGTPSADRHWGFAVVGPDGTPRPVFQAVSDLTQAQPTNMPGAYTPLFGMAEWEGNWEFSGLGADVSEEGGERVTIPFWGTDFGLQVRRGNYRGTFYITVDGQPAGELPVGEEGRAYLVLTSPDYEPRLSMVTVATGLQAGPHTVEITADRGWDQWALAGWSVGYHPDDTVFKWSLIGLSLLALASLVGVIIIGRQMEWRALGRATSAAWNRLSQIAQVLLTAATTGLLWLSAWMTWGVEAGNAFRRLGDGVGITATLAAAGLFYYSPWFLLTLLSGLVLLVLILLRLELGLALIAALAPFYTFPWRLFSKAFSMAEIVTLMTLASWAMHTIAARVGRTGEQAEAAPVSRRVQVLRGLDLGVVLLVIVSVISPFFAEFQRVAWRELRLVILEPAAFYLMLRSSKLDRTSWWRVLDFCVIGGVAVAVIGLVQYAMGINLITAEAGISRLRSVYGSPNNVGLYLGRVLPLLVATLLFAGNRRRRVTYGLATLPVGAAILLSFSKGAIILGVPASLLTIGILAGGRWLWASVAAVAVAGLAAIPLLQLPRFASLLDTQGGSTLFRLKLWRSTLTMIRDHPLLGVGLDNFLYAYRGRYILPTAWQEPDLSHPHNFLLDHMARLGMLGAAAGIWIQAAFWRITLPLRKLRDPDGRALALGLMGAVVDMLAHGLVDHSFFLIDLAFAFFLILALAQALSSKQLE
jgi:O-antigen ligase